MPSSFAWLDYSEDERQRMLDAVDLFKEKGTRDEMGIGSVRDAFADLFFPGTSTIQTRARYFLFVPWVYLQLEQRRVPSSEIAWRARDMEIGLIDALAALGRREEARERYQDALSLRNSYGLLAEDIHPQTGALWGNFPQTYSMAGVILSAMRLSQSWEERYWRASS